ncbi:MAG TPA: putative 2-aminoethylphosphonate ABC transporter permease subunit [Hyphomicrobiaceae bacterium]|nr:putative 2-aminoethylphosphonate ABC transporter permease subunit [Hyphomicrobiaceae bacterium]
MTATTSAAHSAPPAPRFVVRDAWILRAGVALLVVWLSLTIALPLWALLSKSFQNADGRLVGLANYIRYFSTPTLFGSIYNSLGVALLSTAIVVPLAFVYAYALTRTRIAFKGLFYAAALLPLFAPSLLSAISLIYLFGNQGLFKGLLLGASIYGPIGIIIAQVFYCFPHALMIMVAALALADARLYEVAEALGTSRSRIFRTVTLPGAKYGLVNAAFVVFTLVVTDFGIAKVIGGQFNVLATDAYKQVVGQQNFEMGAVVGMVLLVPAVLAFIIDRIVQRRQVALLSARAVPFQPKPNAARDVALALYCVLVAGLLLVVLGTAVWASFITYWPYNLSLTLNNYAFSNFDPTGWSSYFNSVAMAGLTAILGTAIVFAGAYLIEKSKVASAGRAAAHLLAMLPMAVPGLVLGLGYVFFINAKWNPLGFLYGTLLVLVINSIAHFYTVAHITALTSLKQIDPEFESVSASLKVPFWRTFGRVTVPICLPTILDIAVYLFVNALTTVSAVIFLYGSSTKLASIAIVHMDEAGATSAAAGMATVIVLTALAVKLLHLLLDRLAFRRLQAWRRR